MLLLAVHNVDQVTAKVSFSMIMLNDLIKRKALPAELRVRMVIPTSGHQSVSLWDAPDAETLSLWLAEHVNKDCTCQVHEVQEDFTYGIMLELARARAADKVATGGKQAMSSLGQTVGDIRNAAAQQLGALDERTHLITATKETTAAAASRVRDAADSAMQNENVAAAVATLSTGVAAGLSKASAALSWMNSRVKAELGMPPATPANSFVSPVPPSFDRMPVSSSGSPHSADGPHGVQHDNHAGGGWSSGLQSGGKTPSPSFS